MMKSVVESQSISRPERFIAEVAGDDNSLEMVCLNVIFYVAHVAFLSTHFTTIGCSVVVLWIGTLVLALFHH